MNAKQTKLIEQAATVDTDGEGWRKRMDAWLDVHRAPRSYIDIRALQEIERKDKQLIALCLV